MTVSTIEFLTLLNPPVAAAPLPLDGFNLPFVYSLPKLVSSYTGKAGTWVRKSDNATAEIDYLSNSQPDYAGAIAWAQADSATSVVINSYPSQGSIAIPAVQAAVASMPEVWNSVDGIRVDANGNYAPHFDGVDDNMVVTFGQTYAQPLAVTVATEFDAPSDERYEYVISGIDSTNRMRIYKNTDLSIRYNFGSNITGDTAAAGVQLTSVIAKGASSILRVDGSSLIVNLGANGVAGLTIGAEHYSSLYLAGYIPIIAFDPSDRSVDIAAIDAVIMTQLGITPA